MRLFLALILYLEPVLAPYNILFEWNRADYVTVNNLDVYTYTECVMKCTDDADCELVGVLNVETEKKKCLLLKKKRRNGKGISLIPAENKVTLIKEVGYLFVFQTLIFPISSYIDMSNGWGNRYLRPFFEKESSLLLWTSLKKRFILQLFKLYGNTK